MPSPEEMWAWSVDEIRAEIYSLLPEGWTVSEEHPLQGYFSVKLERPTADGPILEHESSNVDLRIALLDVYGRLWVKPLAGQVSPWVRRHELSRESVTRKVVFGGDQVPDPGDLDPEEIAAVYRDRK